MANEKHLMLSIIGDWNDAALSTEGWQVGIRLALVFGSVDPVGTLPNNWNPTAIAISRTETHWNINGNWDIQSSAAPGFNPGDYLNDQAAPAVIAWMGRSALSTKCRVRQLKLSPIGSPSGRLVPAPPYATGTPCVLDWTSAYPTGSNAADLLPLQNAIVASHRTAQIGRTGRGRAFLPGPTTSVMSTDGHLTTGLCNDWRDAEVALLQGLKLSPTIPGDPHIRPAVIGGNFSKYAVINQVRVGNVMDTQRRRRRSIAETFSTAPVTY